jgi:O-antigen biosynthesis protein WbqP
MKRLFDFLSALIIAVIIIAPSLIIALLIKITSKGSILFWSKRIGINNKIFLMPKFRTMTQGTPDVATHLLKDPDQFLTSIGPFLRRSSLDEIPQLYSVLLGDMSLVGPRPALFNQEDLINLRTEKGIHKLKPGITGWAQVNGRDEITIPEKVSLEEEYLDKMSWKMDMYILWLTFVKVLKKDSITH